MEPDSGKIRGLFQHCWPSFQLVVVNTVFYGTLLASKFVRFQIKCIQGLCYTRCDYRVITGWWSTPFTIESSDYCSKRYSNACTSYICVILINNGTFHTVTKLLTSLWLCLQITLNCTPLPCCVSLFFNVSVGCYRIVKFLYVTKLEDFFRNCCAQIERNAS